MLSFKESDLILASILDEKYNIIRSIYFHNPTELAIEPLPSDVSVQSDTAKVKCEYCTNIFSNKYNLKRHQKICAVRIVLEIIDKRNTATRFKEYIITNPNHRMELMMPYNDERGLRMYISGPPRCGKSYLIGQLIREYIRHHPKREIFLFSQVDSDRAIDTVIEEVSERLNGILISSQESI